MHGAEKDCRKRARSLVSPEQAAPPLARGGPARGSAQAAPAFRCRRPSDFSQTMRSDGRARQAKRSYAPSRGRIDAAPLVLVGILMILPTLASLRLPWHPALSLGYLIVVSIGTFFMYSIDKSFAVAHAMRMSEFSLHVLDLLGGWPGGILAQYLIRHKNAKASFQLVFWLTVFAYQFFALEIVTGWQVTHRVLSALSRRV